VTIDGGGKPMVSIVYDRYGNTDKLERILEINAVLYGSDCPLHFVYSTGDL
jgi:hypothetical protein